MVDVRGNQGYDNFLLLVSFSEIVYFVEFSDGMYKKGAVCCFRQKD